jgi:hypothetical protein
MGDPMRPLMWVSKSHAKLGAGLRETDHKIADSSIPKLLDLLDYRRQVNRKTLEGSNNPDRNAQFEHINAAVNATQAAGQPVISIDTKKKELIGTYKNGGSDYCPEVVLTRSMCMISLTKILARRSRTAFTTSPPMPAASVLVSATIQRSSRSIRFTSGWIRWAGNVIRT